MQIVAISACVCALSTAGSSGGRISSKVIDSEEEESGMRRACSLSDLSISPSNKLLHGPVQGISHRTHNIFSYASMLNEWYIRIVLVKFKCLLNWTVYNYTYLSYINL